MTGGCTPAWPAVLELIGFCLVGGLLGFLGFVRFGILDLGMRPAGPERHQIELTTVEVLALIRWHQIEAVLLLSWPASRAHLVRADGLQRTLDRRGQTR